MRAKEGLSREEYSNYQCQTALINIHLRNVIWTQQAILRKTHTHTNAYMNAIKFDEEEAMNLKESREIELQSQQ